MINIQIDIFPNQISDRILYQAVGDEIKKVVKRVDSLARQTKSVMQQIINSSVRRKPNTGNLANSIDIVTPIIRKNSKGIIEEYITGVGDIQKLNIEAPYWYVVNYGVLFGTSIPYVPPSPPLGSFGGNAPDSNLKGSGTQRWSGGNYFMKPSSPIRPMNFISNTLQWLRTVKL